MQCLHRKSRPTKAYQDQLALLKSLTRLSMFVELDVNGGQLMDTMEFLVKPFTLGLEYGRIIVFLNMRFISFQQHIAHNIRFR
jgi:hypothetical protein